MSLRAFAIAALFMLAACETPVEVPVYSAGPPSMPPPPCWDAAGNPLPDDVCAGEAHASSAPEETAPGDGETLPAPPGMPVD